MNILKEFRDITGFSLSLRQTNYLSNKIERMDSFFPKLAILYFSDQQRFQQLQQKIKGWLRKGNSETLYALAGYIYYIAEDFKKAKIYFLKAISLNPENLDNWMDLSFTLRHLKDYNLSNGILFNYDYITYYYKYLGFKSCSYLMLKRLVSEIRGQVFFLL